MQGSLTGHHFARGDTWLLLHRDPGLPHTRTAAAHGCIWTEVSILIGKLLHQAFLPDGSRGGWGGGCC